MVDMDGPHNVVGSPLFGVGPATLVGEPLAPLFGASVATRGAAWPESQQRRPLPRPGKASGLPHTPRQGKEFVRSPILNSEEPLIWYLWYLLTMHFGKFLRKYRGDSTLSPALDPSIVTKYPYPDGFDQH